MDLQSVERVWQPQLLKHNNSSLPENVRMSLYAVFSFSSVKGSKLRGTRSQQCHYEHYSVSVSGVGG